MLGFGSFGRTYLGKDIKKGRNVAIKIVNITALIK
jgi:serine/threonine protein kinase